MKARITKLSTAAIFTFALISLVYLLSGPTSVAIADVVEKVEQYNTVIHRAKRVVYGITEQDEPITLDIIKYVSSGHGVVEEQYNLDGKLMYRMYILREQQGIIMTFPDWKKYVKVPLYPDLVEKLKNLDPQSIVSWFLVDPYTDLGIKEIDGRKCQGFEIINPSIFQQFGKEYPNLFPVEKSSMRLWIDVKTKMPIKGFTTGTVGESMLTSGRKIDLEIEDYDFQWGPKIDPNIFEPNIPDDYEMIDLTKYLKK